jgi:hypothetical protein
VAAAMSGTTHGWQHRVAWGHQALEETRALQPSKPTTDDDLCRQCRFPWFLHPWRYDPEDEEAVRFCSEYPVEAPRAVASWIVP